MRSINVSTAKFGSEYRVELEYIAHLAKVKGSMKVPYINTYFRTYLVYNNIKKC